MKVLKFIPLIFIFVVLQISAQSLNEIHELQKHYESFEYSTVITKADNLLSDKERFSNESLIQIYTLKAASHFAMNDLSDSRKAFIDLLKIKEDFKLDSSQYSPKLIEFFTSVKTEFLDILNVNNGNETQQTEPDTINQIPKQIIKNNFNATIAKSIILPGWGHLQLKENTKGWILTSISTAALGSMIYFIIDANTKENDYLSETNPDLIQKKYNDYNKSYKIRNTLIATYAVVWLYSQIDILFFSNQLGSNNISVNFPNMYQKPDNNRISIAFKFQF